jgi:hypothetical protein
MLSDCDIVPLKKLQPLLAEAHEDFHGGAIYGTPDR